MKGGEMHDEDEESMTPAKSSLLRAEETKESNNDIPFCGCLSLRFYQPYFDVDTADISTRLMNALFYCRRENNFMTLIGDKPDAYGPFWVSLKGDALNFAIFEYRNLSL